MTVTMFVTACGGNTSAPPSPVLASCAPVVKQLGKKGQCYERTTPIVAGKGTFAFHGMKKPPFISVSALPGNDHVFVQAESPASVSFVAIGPDGKLDIKASGTLEFIIVVYNGI